MAGRRGCVNSLWSGTERVRIGERLKATLAGVLELELLRCKQLDLVDAALDNRRPKEQSCVTSCRQQDISPSDITALPAQSGSEDSGCNSGDGTVHASVGRGSNSRWSTLSWDASSDLLSPPTPDPINAVHLDSDSRPSSGFYSVSGSSLSDSCYSVSSEAAQGGQAPARPLRLREQGPQPDNADIMWSDGAVQLEQQQQQQVEAQSSHEPAEESPASVPVDLEATGLSFLSDLCSGLSDSIISSLLQIISFSSSSSSVDPKSQLDSHYCTDLVSRRTKEVYHYPSPLHAVALQSPLFTPQGQAHQASPNPEAPQIDDTPQPTNDGNQSFHLQPNHTSAQVSLTQLEQYILRLAQQYHTRTTASTSDLTSASTSGSVPLRGVCTPGKSHGSTQSLSAFENRSTPCKSLLGNSARVCLSTAGKKATRNSINLGNLPSATGDDLSINLHLNVNLNLTPGLNSSRSLVDTPKTGSCGALRSDFAASTGSASSLSSSTPTPALRTRPRISTCPSSLSHRSSLEVTPSFGSTHFCRSLDWSNSAPEQLSVHGSNAGSAPASQRSSLNQEPSNKLSEDSPMVEEISRLSGLSRAVVVGLMEQGVELDIDCFDVDTPGEIRGHGKSQLTAQTDQSHDYTREMTRPIQLSLSVTHSPQSQSSLTPPLSHSSSPIHPYQSNYMPSPHYSSHYYQHDLPSSTASSPASRPTPRARSPPHPLQPSPMGATPLSVFRRDAPFQCSLPRANTKSSVVDHGGIQPRGGSLRQSGGSGGGWKKGEGLYRGKHASHKLIRAATVSSYAKRENYNSVWAEEKEMEKGAQTPKKNSNRLWSRVEGHLFGKESESEREEMDRAEYGFGWRRDSGGSYRREHRQDKTSFRNNGPKVEYSPIFSKKRGKEDGERRCSSLRLSRRALFRSESQGLLVSRHNEEPMKRALWVSSLDVGQGIGKDKGVRLRRTREEDKQQSSTASLFNLSRSQSLEGSCQSLSPLSSPSFSPSPPRRPLQRSRSLRDLGKRVFGSMRSLSLKRKPSKK